MVFHLIRKEFLEQMLSFRFIVLSAMGALAIWVCLYSGYNHYRERVDDYRMAQAATKERIEEIDDAENWSEFVYVGHLEHKPPVPTSIFVRGLEPFLGRSITNATTIRRLNRSPAEITPLFGVFSPLDLGLIVQIVLSLFALLFTYDAVCGEKEAGSLRLVASFPISKHHILLSKYFGALFPLLIAFGMPLLLGVAVLLLMPDVRFTELELSRIGLIFIACGIYVSVFTCVGLLSSCLTQKASTSFVLLLGFWVTTVVVMPRISLIIADSFRTAPSVYELEAEKEAVSKSNGERWREVRARWIKENPQWMETPEGREAQRLFWRKTRQKVWWEPNLSQHARLDESFRNRYDARLNLAVIIARLSPPFAFNNATVELAGTGLSRQRRFLTTFHRYYRQWYQWFIDSVDDAQLRRINSVKYGEYRWDISDLPRLVYKEIWPQEDVQTALIDIGVMFLWGLIFFLGAYVALLNYDFR